jgi:hypothetical protein
MQDEKTQKSSILLFRTVPVLGKMLNVFYGIDCQVEEPSVLPFLYVLVFFYLMVF